MFSQEPVISLKKVDIYQNDRIVLNDVSFDISKGEFVYLIGRTGSGKSSLLKTLYADLRNYKGDIDIAGFKLNTLPNKKIALLRRKLGIVFQDFQLLFDRSIFDNLLFVLKATGWSNDKKIKERINEVLLLVGLPNAANKMPHQLSGGEQQRVAIARALLNEPEVILADEPTGNLDPEVAEEILNIFFEINRKGTAIVMATHNHHFIIRYPGRTLRVENNQVLDHKSILHS
jgi:cell division transport system ATP-binding protein